jgi:hypothetical protein
MDSLVAGERERERRGQGTHAAGRGGFTHACFLAEERFVIFFRCLDWLLLLLLLLLESCCYGARISLFRTPAGIASEYMTFPPKNIDIRDLANDKR